MSDFRYYRPDPFPPITKNLIIINVLVFLAQLTLGITGYLVMYPLRHPLFEPYQIATHMFSHANFMHILFNMFMLYMFGRTLENVWGPKRFLLFYLICGVGAAAAHLLIQEMQISSIGPALGASGAVMGVLVGFAYLFPNTELYLMFIPVPIKAKWLVMGYVAFDLIFGIANRADDNVARFAHLGGALTGFVLVLIWNKSNRNRFY